MNAATDKITSLFSGVNLISGHHSPGGKRIPSLSVASFLPMCCVYVCLELYSNYHYLPTKCKHNNNGKREYLPVRINGEHSSTAQDGQMEAGATTREGVLSDSIVVAKVGVTDGVT